MTNTRPEKNFQIYQESRGLNLIHDLEGRKRRFAPPNDPKVYYFQLDFYRPTDTDFDTDLEIDGCYDGETDVLTRAGWKRFGAVNISSDEILTMNPLTFKMEYAKATAKIERPHRGKMFHFKSNTIDLRVTPDHNMFVRGRSWNGPTKKPYRFLKAKSVFGSRWFFRFIGDWVGEELATFEIPDCTWAEGARNKKVFPVLKMDSWLRFLGWWFAEGSTTHSGYTTLITQSRKSPHLEEIRSILRDVGFRFDENGAKKREAVNFRINGRQLYEYLRELGDSGTKHIPDYIKRLSVRQINLFLDGYIKGDGDTKSIGHNTGRLTTVSPQLANDVQELLLKAGYIAKIHTERPHNSTLANGRHILARNCRLVHRILYTKRKESLYQFDTSVSEVEEEVAETVYCLELPKFHTLMVRRSGKPVWCGNSRYHSSDRERHNDNWRDRIINACGKKVIRIPAAETEKRFWPDLDKILPRAFASPVMQIRLWETRI